MIKILIFNAFGHCSFIIELLVIVLKVIPSQNHRKTSSSLLGATYNNVYFDTSALAVEIPYANSKSLPPIPLATLTFPITRLQPNTAKSHHDAASPAHRCLHSKTIHPREKMSRTTATICKFIGTISLGLLTVTPPLLLLLLPPLPPYHPPS